MLREASVGQLSREALKVHGAITKRPRYGLVRARLEGFAKDSPYKPRRALRQRRLRGNKSNLPRSLRGY